MAAGVKMLVAIHGIGDQVGYSTVQSIAGRLAAYNRVPAVLPLGRFYPSDAAGDDVIAGPIVMQLPEDPEQLKGFGFAEVYWADVAREVVKRGHILQEAKSWVRTITARLAVRTVTTTRPLPTREQDRIITVLDEMVQTIFVLERLSLVAAKAGLFKFSLRSVLVDFIGDVQLVADFGGYRSSILQRFDAMMEKARTIGGGSNELYLVAHSEGSVLMFKALLTALEQRAKYPWIESVKGVMTIGSPIEIHHLLWPELWDSNKPGRRIPEKPAKLEIPWHNYYDRGDPVAYDLTETTAWLKKTGFAEHLKLKTFAYSRAHLPGKAHVDYWHDDDVFGHFLNKVVGVPGPEGEKPRFEASPANKLSARVTSFLIPNLLVWLLMFAATYALYRPVAGALTEGSLATTRVLRDVFGIGVLLLSATAAARLPRLTDGWKWWALSAVLLGVGMFFYANVTCAATREVIGGRIPEWALLGGFSLHGGWFDRVPGCTASGAVAQTNRVLLLTALLTLGAAWAASWRPRWGVKILPVAGAVLVLVLVGTILFGAEKVEMSPIVIGAALFLYLWWLTSLLFDLVFVWHRYIRSSVMTQRLAELTETGYIPTKMEEAFNHVAKTVRAN